MKKLFVLTLMAIVSMTTMAANLKTVSGSVNVLSENATASYQIDLNGARWEKKEDFKEWCGEDYNKRVTSMNEKFASSFNEYSNGLKIGENPKYNIVLKIENFERKQGMGLWGSCRIKFYGTLNIVDIASGSVVCSIKVDGVGGDTDFVENDRFPKTIDEICKQIFKLKK